MSCKCATPQNQFGGAWGEGDTTGDDDGRGEIREHEPGMVGGLGDDERDASWQRGRDGVGISDGARVEPGAGGVHGDGAIW